jgi:nitrilase
VKVALIQFNAGSDKKKNLKRAVDFVRRAIARKAKFVLLPEVFIFRGDLVDGRDVENIAESIDGPSIQPFRQLAREAKVHILAGSIYENSHRRGKAYNTSVLIGPSGKSSGVYRKIHLFEAKIALTPNFALEASQRRNPHHKMMYAKSGFNPDRLEKISPRFFQSALRADFVQRTKSGLKSVSESKRFCAGGKMAMARVDNFKAGMSICYDLRFPELYLRYALLGADILCVPSAFTKKTGEAHWEVLLRSRAIENLCYVLAPNQIGEGGQGIQHYGHSMIIDPWGKILAQGSAQKEEIITADIDSRVIKDARRKLPMLHQRKLFKM